MATSLELYIWSETRFRTTEWQGYSRRDGRGSQNRGGEHRAGEYVSCCTRQIISLEAYIAPSMTVVATTRARAVPAGFELKTIL